MQQWRFLPDSESWVAFLHNPAGALEHRHHTLINGEAVQGFLYEHYAVGGATEISLFGGRCRHLRQIRTSEGFVWKQE